MSVTVDGTNSAVVFPGIVSGQATLSATPVSTGAWIQYLPNESGTLLVVNTSGNIVIPSAGGGSITLSAPNIAGNVNFVFPPTNGNPGEVLTSDGAGNTSWTNNGTTSFSAGTTGFAPSVPTVGNIVLSGTLITAHGGTGLTGGTSGGVPYFDSGTTMASSSTLAAANVVLGGGVGAAPYTTPTGAGVVASFGNAVNTPGGLSVLNGSGVLDIAQGGTGANTAVGAANNLLPSQASHAGQALVTDGAGNLSWSGALPLTVGASVILSGTTGSILIDTAGVLQQIVMGTGVAAALAINTNSPNGLSVLNASGILDIAQGGTGANTAAGAANNLLPSQSAPQAGYVLSTDGAGNLSWVSNAAPLTVGTSSILSGAANSLLIETGANLLGEIVMGTGVAAALAINTGAAGGFVLAGASPVTQHAVVIGGASGVLNSTAVGSAGQILTSGGAGVDPTWTTATYPSTTTINQLLYSSANNTVAELATANGGILNTSAAGVPSITATPTLGVPGTTAGTLALSGATSGTVTLQSQAAASGTLTLPNGNGTVLAAAGTLTQGSTLFVGTGGIVSENNANYFWDDTNIQLIIGANTTVTAPADIQLVVTKDAYINGMTVGLGSGQDATNTAVGAGVLDANSGSNNTGVGVGALQTNAAGAGNTGIGAGALFSNTSGANNTAVGYGALQLNAGGSPNTAVGAGSLASNVSGTNNVAVGDSALAANTSNLNTAVGSQALQSNTTGQSNTGVGYLALSANTGGGANIAVGQSALGSNLTGIYNTAVGALALANATGSSNAAFGFNAAYFMTTGSQNTAIGTQALQFATTGANNTAVGWQAMLNSDSTSNTAVGTAAAQALTTGSNNVAVGATSFQNNTSGSNNVAVGNSAMALGVSGSNNTAVGAATLANVTGAANTAVGQQAGFSITTGAGNTLVGDNAGYFATGNANTLVGRYDGQSYPVNATGSNYVTLSDGFADLKFIADGQRVWHMIECTAAPAANPPGGYGYLYVEGGALKYRSSAGTITVIAPL